MPRKLKTGWVALATSGPVVHGKEDGRVVKKEWLEDIAETFNTKVFTPQMWFDHRRYFSGGNVVAVKLEPATEPELKGEVQLFGILAPNDALTNANRYGDYTFPSIEVGENYRGTGKYFLKGLGVTDQPASAGVTELNFSEGGKNEKAHLLQGEQFNLADACEQEEKDNPGLVKHIFKTLLADSTPPAPQDEDDMNEKQFNEFKSEIVTAISGAFTEQNTAFSAISAKLEAQAAAPNPSENGDHEEEAASVSAADFSALQENFNTLQTQFNTLLNTSAGSTPTGENTGSEGTTETI